MRLRIAIIYNEPDPSRYTTMREEKAVLGVLDEVAAVFQALTELGYPVERIPLAPPLEQVREKVKSLTVDLVFNLFEGFDGRPETEAIVAGMLEELGLVHTGCPSKTLALALDKGKAKTLLEAAGIATPRFQTLTPETLYQFHLKYPCIIKPRTEDASHGISEESVVNDAAGLARQVARVSELFGESALVEEFATGREFNVTVLGNRNPEVLPSSEIVYTLPPAMPRVLTFAAKWEPDTVYFQGTQAVCPAEINEALKQQIAENALAAFRLLGCRGYARVDMRLDAEGNLKVIEVNPNPDLSPEYGAARQAQAAGISYSQLIDRIVSLALENTKVTEPGIRVINKPDKPTIMQILRQTPEFEPAEVDVAEELIDCYLEDPVGSDYFIYVAEVKKSIAGYICYGPTPLTRGTWDIYWMVTAPRKKGQGIGSHLLAFAENRIRETGGRLVFIETSSKPEYESTRRFHYSQGYELVCQVPDFYAPGDDKLLLRKRLN
ncbi:MAG: GNAT family N-acetyltransferase [Dehalococcoidales bacterium]|nr:GNAT family N-acetyltransferase [Dehalococcoidales bacterium]